jgi:hypothetical protein
MFEVTKDTNISDVMMNAPKHHADVPGYRHALHGLRARHRRDGR